MEISKLDLINISNTAKTLKQRDFAIVNFSICGLDYIQSYFITTQIVLSSNIFFQMNTLVKFNTRELSAFVKTLTLEDTFKLNYSHDDVIQGESIYTITSMNGEELPIRISNTYNHPLCMYMKRFKYMQFSENEDVSDLFRDLYSLRMTDGTIRLQYKRYFMMLFSGIIPLNKADKLSIAIHDTNDAVFIARFTIKKKGGVIVTVYMSFLNIM